MLVKGDFVNKKVNLLLIFFISLAMVFICGFVYIYKIKGVDKSSIKKEDYNKQSEMRSKIFFEKKDDFEKKVQEYGNNKTILKNKGYLLAYVNYPKKDNPILDNEIKIWIDKILKSYELQTAKKNADLSITYESYVIDDKYISVAFEIIYNNESYAHPEYLVKTFNYDKQNKKIIKLNDVYSEDALKKIKEKILEKINLYDSKVVGDVINEWIFTHKGIKFLLGKGKYTPSSDGVINVVFSKELLKDSGIAYFDDKKQDDVKDEVVVIDDSLKVKEKDTNGKKLIAITFDDGPGQYTEKLLEILKKYDAKATFYVLGTQISKYPNTLKKIANSGHEIASHTWDHKQLTRLSDKDVETEFLKTKAEINRVVEIDVNMVRAPYGSVDSRVKKIAKNNGIYFVHWSIDTLDWKTKNSKAIQDVIIKNAKDGAIVLCHDIHKQTVGAMDTVFDKLKKDGYEFVTVSELFKLKNKSFDAGNVYYDAN